MVKLFFSFLLLLTPPRGRFYIECTFSYGALFVFIYGFIILSQLAENSYSMPLVRYQSPLVCICRTEKMENQNTHACPLSVNEN